jgi:hypothetical protein
MSDIQTQLTEEIAKIDWKSLIPHGQRDALIVVSPDLNLIDVGEAMANDNVAIVQTWISQQLIRKPFSEELSSWNTLPDKEFTSLIIQPFVLIQESKTSL